MASVTARRTQSGPALGTERVDPREPRFGRAVTATLLALGIVLQTPEFVYAVTAVLWLTVLSDWQVDPYRVVWRRLGRRYAGRARRSEPAAPHRFATLAGATVAFAATVLLLSRVPPAGYGLAGLLALLSVAAAAFDRCLGCELYRQVAFFRERDWV